MLPAQLLDLREPAAGELGQVEHLRQHPEGPVGLIGRCPHVVMERGGVAALDVRDRAPADAGIDEEFDRATVLRRRAGLAVGGDAFVEEAPAQFAHGERLGVRPVLRRRVLPGPGAGDDLGCSRARLGGCHGSVRSDGDLDGASASADLDDVDLAAGGVDVDAEALEIVVPDDALALARGEGIDGPLGDSGHGGLPLSCPGSGTV